MVIKGDGVNTPSPSKTGLGVIAMMFSNEKEFHKWLATATGRDILSITSLWGTATLPGFYDRVHLWQVAMCIAIYAHREDKDKNGEPYIMHIMDVERSSSFADYAFKAIALLHDIVEHEHIQLCWLDRIFPRSYTSAIHLLTRDRGTTYKKYIVNIAESGSELAVKVKIADLESNIRTRYMPHPASIDKDTHNTPWIEENLSMFRRYNEALAVLTGEKSVQEYLSLNEVTSSAQ